MQHARMTKAFWRLACAVACALIVAIGSAGAAIGAEAACFEGESMSDSSNAIAAVSDANASGRCPTGGNEALAYAQTGKTANKRVGFSSAAEKVEIRVRGADTAGTVTLPRVRVFMDGTDNALNKILDQQVTSSYETLTADLTRSADRAAGTHTIYVKMANWDTGDKIWVDWTAFTYAPAADTTPPDTTIDSVAQSDVAGRDVEISFSGTDDTTPSGSLTFECALDGGAYSACTSPKSYANLSSQTHAFSVRATDAASNQEATPASQNFLVKNIVNVTSASYNAVANDSGNDTAAFEDAMAAAGADTVTYVPAGTWRVHNVSIPSNTEVDVDSDATIKHYGTNNGPLFSMQGVQNTSFGQNMYVRGVNGRFLVDVYDANTNVTPFRVRSVKNFSIENVDFQNKNDAAGTAANRMALPNTINPDISFLPMDTTKLGGEWEHAHNGLVKNAHAFDSTYGWGLVQMTGGEDIHFQDIYGEGGVPLRLENFENNATTIDGITADNVTGENCKVPLTLQAHNAFNGSVSVTDLTANSCSFGINLAWDSAYSSAGFTDVAINGANVNAGSTAQTRDGTDGWSAGNSQSCVEADANLPWEANVSITGLDCGTLSNRSWPQ